MANLGGVGRILPLDPHGTIMRAQEIAGVSYGNSESFIGESYSI